MEHPGCGFVHHVVARAQDVIRPVLVLTHDQVCAEGILPPYIPPNGGADIAEKDLVNAHRSATSNATASRPTIVRSRQKEADQRVSIWPRDLLSIAAGNS